MSTSVDFPFYREIEEFKLGLRPPIERFALIVIFSLGMMMVGIILGLEQGRKPYFTSQQETAKSASTSKQIVAIKSALEANFIQSDLLPDYRVVENGNELEIQFGTYIMFAGGQASLSGSQGDILHNLAVALLPVTKDRKIRFEAYTDDAPLSTTTALYPTNWELSGARAARVLRLFAKAGFPVENLTFVGWGETYPMLPNRDASGEPILQNRLKNRRMVVRVLAAQ